MELCLCVEIVNLLAAGLLSLCNSSKTVSDSPYSRLKSSSKSTGYGGTDVINLTLQPGLYADDSDEKKPRDLQ